MANQKTLSERVMENVASLPMLGRANKNMALFLSHKAEIAQALDDGWSVKAVWMTLHKEEKFPGTYACFRLYVARFLHSKPQSLETTKERETTQAEPNRRGQVQASTADTFTFSGKPKEDELI